MNKPTDHQISDEQLSAFDLTLKCVQSFLYFVEGCCWIQDRKTGADLRFKLWPGQKSSLPTIISAKFLIILKARQLGLTWLTAAYVLWKAIFNKNQLIVVISGKEELAVEFLERVKFMFDRLPESIKPRVGKRNTTELLFGVEVRADDGQVIMEGLNSHIKSVASTADAGQSKTISLLIMDESALGRYCKEIWSAAKPTLEHADGQAIIISNPSKDKPGWAWTRDIYTKSMKGLNVFKRIFLNWECVPGREPSADGTTFLDLQRMDGLDESDIICQYPTTEAEAISAMLGSYFGESVAGHVPEPGTRGHLQDGKFVDSEFGVLEIWEMPYDQVESWNYEGWENRYAIGSDVSEGLGQTASVAYVIDRCTDEIVCKMHSNRIDAYIWANMIHKLGQFYNNNMDPSLACIERTGPGQTTVKRLQELKHPQYVKIKVGKVGVAVTKEYGWNESQQSKHELCGDFKTYLNRPDVNVRCAQLIDECTTFVRKDNGVLKHEDGKFDDCVMGAGCTIQAAKFMGGPPKLVGTERAEEIRIKREIAAQNLERTHEDEWNNVNKEVDLMTSEDYEDIFD